MKMSSEKLNYYSIRSKFKLLDNNNLSEICQIIFFIYISNIFQPFRDETIFKIGSNEHRCPGCVRTFAATKLPA